MALFDIFAQAASQFKSHYLAMTRALDRGMTPTHYTQQSETPQIAPQPADSYGSATAGDSAPTSDINGTKAPTTGSETPTATDQEPKSDEYTPSTNPAGDDGTYSFQRKATLDYKLRLEFDLAALSRTVIDISEGDTASIETLAAAGFGLSADINIKGRQTINMQSTSDPTRQGLTRRSIGRALANARQMGSFNVQNRDFVLQSFFKESTQMKSSFKEMNINGHTRATNSFALRYRMDNQFSFGSLQRFNVQTKAVGDQMPDQLSSYFGAAGAVAEKGTPEMMATFFDAVDGYLDNAEDAMIEKVTAFFDQAASELGFSGSLVEMAKEQLLSSVENFFDRVEIAVDSMESKFVPASAPAPSDPPVVDVPVGDTPIVDPLDLIDPTDTAVVDQLAQLAEIE